MGFIKSSYLGSAQQMIIIGRLIPITFLCLIFGSVNADLSTIPPLKSQEKQVNTNQTTIVNLLIKARTAINQKRLTLPKKNNAVYYLDQLLSLSPDNESALNYLTEIHDIYTNLAYKKLDENNIKLAKTYYDKAESITSQFNIDIDSQVLTNLENIIITRQAKLKKRIRVNKDRTSAKKIKKKKQMMSELADLQREIAFSQSMMEQYKAKLKQHKKAVNSSTKTEKKAQITKQKPSLSLTEQEKIVVIVNKRNKVSSLTLNQLKALFKKQKKQWSNGETITLFLPQPDSSAFLWLTRNIFLKKSPASVVQFYMKGVNRNIIKMPTTSSNGVLDVSRIVGSIAIVKAGEAKGNSSVKIIQINGT